MAVKLKKYFDVAFSLIKEAEVLIMNRVHSRKSIETKSCDVDFVTETDKEVEELLIQGLKQKFPDHKFIGEESTSEGIKPELTNEPTWIIDPVDGTLNFVHGFYPIAISVGLFIDKEPQVGIISVPLYDKTFTAIKGQGAHCNGQPIKVSDVTDLSKSLVIIEGGTSRDADRVSTVKENLCTLIPKIHGYRASGSAAFNISSIAMGGCDAYFEFGLHAWDMAAGCLLVTEAGGVVLDPSGGPFDIMSRRLLCASSLPLAEQLSKVIKDLKIPREDE